MEEKEFNDLMRKLITPPSIQVYSEGLSLKDIFDLRLKELDLSQRQVEDLLDIEYKSLMMILNRTGKRVDILNIMKLSQFLGMTTDEMLKVYTSNEMQSDAIGKIEQARKHSFIATHFDLTALKKCGFISSKADVASAEKRIVNFFGLKDIYEYENFKYFPAFSRTKNKSNNPMRTFWINSACYQFETINNPYEYDRSSLVDLMPKIRPYTRKEKDGLMTVIRALYKVGVTVIYQPHLINVQVRGAALVLKNKPCIVLTDVYKNYPTLWFALLHELYHILYDYDELSKQTYHLSSDEPDLLLSEDDANKFAREYLFPHENMQYILPFINDDFLIRDYANELQLHPSIIYIFYSHDRKTAGDKFAWIKKQGQEFPKVSDAVKSINVNIWDGETIEEGVKQLKETVFQNI